MRNLKLNVMDKEYEVQVKMLAEGKFQVLVNGNGYTAQIEDEQDKFMLTAVDGSLFEIEFEGEPTEGELNALVNNIKRKIGMGSFFRGKEISNLKKPLSFLAESQISPTPVHVTPKVEPIHNGILAPMPGKVVAVEVRLGEQVAAGDVVVILEAMKMENEIITNRAGKISDVRVKEGDSVDADDVLVVIE